MPAVTVGSHATGVVDATVHPEGKITFSVPAYYTRYGRTSRRHIMETGENGEGVMRTIERALDDEISEEPGSATLELKDEKPFLIKLMPDERNPGKKHLKAFFFVNVTGQRRTVPKKDGDEELGPMVDVEAGELLAMMEDQVTGRCLTVPIHLDATKAAIRVLANKHPEVSFYYMKLLASLPEEVPLSEDEWEAIRAYNKWFKAA